MKLRACCGVLDKIAATRFAAKWDNVGLLVEPVNVQVKRILLTNDLTEAVMDEAIEYGANLIISYHPPLFTAFKRISQNNWKDRLVTQALKHDIAIYSPHTAHDAWKDGVNAWLIKASRGFAIKISSRVFSFISPLNHVSIAELGHSVHFIVHCS